MYTLTVRVEILLTCFRIANHSCSYGFVRQVAVIVRQNFSLWSSWEAPMFWWELKRGRLPARCISRYRHRLLPRVFKNVSIA